MKLAGDFDATSAYELIYAIKKLPEDTVKISIYANGLKNIHPFGLNVFHRYMSPLKGQFTKIVFTDDVSSKPFILAEMDKTIQKWSGKALRT